MKTLGKLDYFWWSISKRYPRLLSLLCYIGLHRPRHAKSWDGEVMVDNVTCFSCSKSLYVSVEDRYGHELPATMFLIPLPMRYENP